MTCIWWSKKGDGAGISLCVKWHAKANNKYIEGDYNNNLPSSYLVCLDAKNLYGWTTSKHKCIMVVLLGAHLIISILNVPDDSPVGFIFLVDNQYPQHLQNLS